MTTPDPMLITHERLRQLVSAVVAEVLDAGEDIDRADVVDEVLSRHASSIADMVHGLTVSVLSDLFAPDTDSDPEVLEGEIT